MNDVPPIISQAVDCLRRDESGLVPDPAALENLEKALTNSGRDELFDAVRDLVLFAHSLQTTFNSPQAAEAIIAVAATAQPALEKRLGGAAEIVQQLAGAASDHANNYRQFLGEIAAKQVFAGPSPEGSVKATQGLRHALKDWNET